MPHPSMKDCNLFFFDCETGGLNHDDHDMVEVAVIVTDPTGETMLSTYEAKVMPKKPVHPKAAAVNGFTREKWATEAIDLDRVMIELLSRSKGAVFVSHNTPFDWGFLNAEMALRKQQWGGDYHKIDTIALATPLLKAGLVENLKLETLIAHFGIVNKAPHRAMGDARACYDLYMALMRRYAPLFQRAA